MHEISRFLGKSIQMYRHGHQPFHFQVENIGAEPATTEKR